MAAELQTIWISRQREGAIDQVNQMLADGWELVQWQPVVVPPAMNPNSRVTRNPSAYDAFLLRKG